MSKPPRSSGGSVCSCGRTAPADDRPQRRRGRAARRPLRASVPAAGARPLALLPRQRHDGAAALRRHRHGPGRPRRRRRLPARPVRGAARAAGQLSDPGRGLRPGDGAGLRRVPPAVHREGATTAHRPALPMAPALETRGRAGDSEARAAMLESLAEWVCGAVPPGWVYKHFQMEPADATAGQAADVALSNTDPIQASRTGRGPRRGRPTRSEATRSNSCSCTSSPAAAKARPAAQPRSYPGGRGPHPVRRLLPRRHRIGRPRRTGFRRRHFRSPGQGREQRVLDDAGGQRRIPIFAGRCSGNWARRYCSWESSRCGCTFGSTGSS